MRGTKQALFCSFSALLLTACASPPPQEPNNICSIFTQYSDWYKAAYNMEKKWGTPIHVAMAIVKHESAFVHDARPPKDYVLGFIPWGNISSAYGYPQALDGTWAHYQKETNAGGSRTDFASSLDFIGWYTTSTRKQLRIPLTDAYNQYLVYHEGVGGYRNKSHNKKPTLLRVARNVNQQAQRYQKQLQTCRAELEKKRTSWWWW